MKTIFKNLVSIHHMQALYFEEAPGLFHRECQAGGLYA